MTQFDFTADDVVNEVRGIALSRHDYVYGDGTTDGSYLGASVENRTGQRCIVGQALHSLGMPDEVLEKYEGKEASYITNALLDRPSLWLDMVQEHQDRGVPWGEAVARADGDFDDYWV